MHYRHATTVATLEIAGQTLDLLPDAAAFWVEKRTLLVADVHFGKAASFRAASVPVPGGTTGVALRRLDVLIRETAPLRILFLGDLWHAKAGRTPQVIEEVGKWRSRHKGIQVVLIEGNHDRKSGPLPAELDIVELQEPLVESPFAFCHEPVAIEGLYAFAGHIHPCVALSGPGRQSIALPCFWFGPQVAVLPAFGEFTGCAKVRPCEGDAVYVICDGSVVRV